WWGVAILIAALVLLYVLRPVLLPFVIAGALAYALNPVVNGLERIGLPRALATLLIVLLMGVAAGLALFLIIPVVITQMRDLATSLPQLMDDARTWIEHASRKLIEQYPGLKDALERATKELSESWGVGLAGLAQGLWSGGLALLNFLGLVLITPIVMFYLLNDWPRLLERADRLLPHDMAPAVHRLAAEMNGVLSGFVRGQGTLCIVLALLYGTGLSLIGIKWGLLIGFVAGLLSFVPYVGLIVGLLTAGTLAVLQSWPDWVPLAKVAAVFAAGQALDAAFLSPRLVAGRIRLHPVWLIFALFAFGYLFGLVGVFVAVPVAALIGVIVRFALEEYQKSRLYAGAGGGGSHPGPAT
ncbi:MAG: AI-2E family transporter, partial [Hyphomicrobiaceae bacterium]